MSNVWWPNPGMPTVKDNNLESPDVKDPDPDDNWPTHPDVPGHLSEALYGESPRNGVANV